jgi:hypothetical protein
MHLSSRAPDGLEDVEHRCGVLPAAPAALREHRREVRVPRKARDPAARAVHQLGAPRLPSEHLHLGRHRRAEAQRVVRPTREAPLVVVRVPAPQRPVAVMPRRGAASQ